jgi:hypothetical protein
MLITFSLHISFIHVIMLWLFLEEFETLTMHRPIIIRQVHNEGRKIVLSIRTRPKYMYTGVETTRDSHVPFRPAFFMDSFLRPPAGRNRTRIVNGEEKIYTSTRRFINEQEETTSFPLDDTDQSLMAR